MVLDSCTPYVQGTRPAHSLIAKMEHGFEKEKKHLGQGILKQRSKRTVDSQILANVAAPGDATIGVRHQLHLGQ